MAKSYHTVYGAPGCGKTFELLRICEEYAEQGASVLFLSHTKAAAQELVSRLPNKKNARIEATTIHSQVFQLLQLSREQVVSRERMVQFGEEIGVAVSGEFDITGEQERVIEEGDEALSIMSRAAAKRVAPVEEYMESERPLPLETFKYVSESYDKWKTAMGYIDFTDMLHMFDATPVPINYDVLIVDEAQDLSVSQWDVIRHLSSDVQHVITAGDPDQQLFSWGGSDTHGMRKFIDENNASVHVLPQSYRIPAVVHKAALTVRDRISVKSDINYKPRDEEGIITYTSNPADIMFDSTDTLVLYRTHSLRKELEQVAMDAGIPYTCINGYKSLWDGHYGNAVRTFKKVQETGKCTGAQARVMNKYCRTNNPPKDVHWQHWLNIPDRFLDYMLKTEGMEPTCRFSTIHGAKGMEAERVILYTGLSQRVVDGMTHDSDAEHRVFYVGVTRARHRLDIVVGENNYDL